MQSAVFHPLGDQAVLVYLANEDDALRFAQAVRDAREPWVLDVVQAYASVAVFFDQEQTDYAVAARRLENIARTRRRHAPHLPRCHRVPCCYSLGLDLKRIAKHTGLTPDQIVASHAGTEYTVYAIGFCPGFPYLGYLPAELCGVPRLDSPRVRVEAGSVGLTGRQTGIYTEPRPGGWNIVGRTPLELVNVHDGYFPIRTGDKVRFYVIDEREFEKRLGQRLEEGTATTDTKSPMERKK
jgi:inhibitor of KinA